MTIKEIISRLRKDPKDAWYYIQGTVRMNLYNGKFKWLLRKHILQQFEWRRDETPAKKCNAAHSCLCCGCLTPDLFFADKPCSTGKDKWCQDQELVQCYPAMMSRSEWNKYKKCKQK